MDKMTLVLNLNITSIKIKIKIILRPLIESHQIALSLQNELLDIEDVHNVFVEGMHNNR